MCNDLDDYATMLETCIPEGRAVEGLEYGRHVSTPGWAGYYVSPEGTGLWGVARMTPDDDAVLDDAATVEAIDAELRAAVRQYLSEMPDEGRGCPVVIVEAGDSWLEAVTELDPVASLDDAKAAAREAGYVPIPDGEGGNTETTDAWQPERGTVHVVTVEPLAAVAARRRYGEPYRIDNKENAWMGDSPVTMFTAYERRGDAYVHAGRFAADGHDATDAECVETVEGSDDA